MRLPAALSACFSARRRPGRARSGARGLAMPARRVTGGRMRLAPWVTSRRGGGRRHGHLSRGHLGGDRHLRRCRGRRGRDRRGGTCRWVRARPGGAARRRPVPAVRAGNLPGAAGANAAGPWLAARAVRSGGRAGWRGGRGDPCPRLSRRLLGGGAHVRRHRVAPSLDLALGGGSRRVPRIGKEHADGDRGECRYEPGTALAAQSAARSYPRLHAMPLRTDTERTSRPLPQEAGSREGSYPEITSQSQRVPFACPAVTQLSSTR